MNSPETPYTRYYHLCLDITGKPVLVAGGGEVARRKAAALCDCGARVTVVSPRLEPVLEYMAFQKEIQWLEREFEPADLEGKFLAVAATDNRDVNRQVALLAREKDILCNVADAPDEGSFIVPSLVERGPLTIAISTSGISPTLAASIRQELELAYGEEYGALLELLSSLRHQVIQEFASPQARQQVFDRMIASRALSLLRSGLKDQARKELEDIMNDARQDPGLNAPARSLPVVQPPQ